ncbi:hypothetical protein ABIC53_000002 [Microbacterium sp. 1262]
MLGRFETVDEVEAALAGVTIIDVSFSDAFPASPLHWIIADRSRSITVESVREGLRVSPELPLDRYSRGRGRSGSPATSRRPRGSSRPPSRVSTCTGKTSTPMLSCTTRW